MFVYKNGELIFTSSVVASGLRLRMEENRMRCVIAIDFNTLPDEYKVVSLMVIGNVSEQYILKILLTKNL